MNAHTLSTPQIQLKNDVLTTTSLAVAEFFGRRHDNVTQKIENLSCSTEFATTNFSGVAKTVPTHNGGTKEITYYEITQDGFTFLAMGFTGVKAAAFKESYINAFRAMETELRKSYKKSPFPHIQSGESVRMLHAAAWLQNKFIINQEQFLELAVNSQNLVLALDAIKRMSAQHQALLNNIEMSTGIDIMAEYKAMKSDREAS